MDSTSDSSRDCLCLVCRRTGHVVKKCPLYTWLLKHPGPGSVPPPDAEHVLQTPPFDPLLTVPESTQALCERCSRLEVPLTNIPSHHPIVWEDLEEKKYLRRAIRKTSQIPPLGPIRSLRFLSTCPLCRLILFTNFFSIEEIEDIESGGELVLVTGWMMHRLEPDLYWKGCGKGMGPYAKCLYTAMATRRSLDAGAYKPRLLLEDAMEAIGVIDIGENHGTPALGVRRVDPKSPDYDMIKDWLRRCDELHQTTCRPLVSEDLKRIKLVNVETRQVVMYPPDGCDYIALSYVWGGAEQPSYKLGDIVSSALGALEDAMVVTRTLGKQYFWADSLCIEQENDKEKVVQIALMSAIYSGAWATIIPLSGHCAHTRLPRVGTLQGVIPQLSCEIRGKRLLSVMPTLSQQISWSRWGTRAWTFQEGFLSPRRLFFTNHQVYFECNSFQCCESLDESNSPFHIQSDEQRRVSLDDVAQDLSITGPEGIIGRGVLRDPFRPVSSAVEAQVDDDNFKRYQRLVRSYTTKQMTHDADSLNAFSAMLTRLKESYYEEGFLQGLPIDDLPRALTWFHITPPRRRIEFPAWSWAGWEGEVEEYAVEGTYDRSDDVMPPLRVWKAGCDGHPELVYNFNPTPNIIKSLEENDMQDGADDSEDVSSWEDVEDSNPGSDSEAGYDSDVSVGENAEPDFKNDPVFRLANIMLEENPTALPKVDGNELLIEGILVQLKFTETPGDRQYNRDVDTQDHQQCSVQFEGQHRPQLMNLWGHHAAELVKGRNGGRQEFLLLSRERSGRTTQKIDNALLLIDWDGDIANRVGVASLKLDNMELLQSCKPERRLFKLK